MVAILCDLCAFAVKRSKQWGLEPSGGRVHRFVDFLVRCPFRHRFEAKGRFSRYLALAPTGVFTAQNPALMGLAAVLGR